jgi:predicted DNA-binding protein with PD1-like motif
MGTSILALIVLTGAVYFFLLMGKSKQLSANTLTHAFRLKPGEDLLNGIDAFIKANDIEAGYIITCAGSLTDYNIRFANQPEGSAGTGHFEIVSLSGTLSKNGSHIHISISDSTGRTIGGHLLKENIVYTTAEMVIGEHKGLEFTRENDGTTPWEELQIREKIIT